jgi:hypothetical protein
MKLSNRRIEDVIILIEALPALNKAPKANFALAKNLDRLEREYKPFKLVKEKIWRSHFGSIDEAPPGDARIPAFLAEINPIYDEEVDFTPHFFHWEDFNLEVNPLSPKTIKELFFLLKQDGDDAACPPPPVNLVVMK